MPFAEQGELVRMPVCADGVRRGSGLSGPWESKLATQSQRKLKASSDRCNKVAAQPIVEKFKPRWYILAMTALMHQVVQHLESLPDSQQDVLASLLLEELDGELHWDATLSDSQALLGSLAQQALADHDNGLTVPGGFDEA